MTQSQKNTTPAAPNGIPANPLVKSSPEWLENPENHRLDTPGVPLKVASQPTKSLQRSSTNMDLLDPTLAETTRASISALGGHKHGDFAKMSHFGGFEALFQMYDATMNSKVDESIGLEQGTVRTYLYFDRIINPAPPGHSRGGQNRFFCQI